MSENVDNQKQLDALIGIVAAILHDVPAWPTAMEQQEAAWALWSAVHGIVVMNYFGGDEATAREQTTAQIRLLLTVVADGAFAATRDRN